MYINPELSNSRDISINAIKIDKALVNTGAVHLCISKITQIQLNLEKEHKRQVTIANGKEHSVPYVGPVRVAFGNSTCLTGALVLGDKALLGAIPIKDMDLVLNPVR